MLLWTKKDETKKQRGNGMLYIIRHGKTDWNVQHKLQGRTDIPLNEEGRQMAAEAGERYREISFDICYCSPLIRARETAEILLKDRGIPIILDDRLQEMGFGTWEGYENVFENPDCPMYTLFKDPPHYAAPEGAEGLDELFARTGSFLKEVVEPALQEGKKLLIVGHGAMNSSIVCQIRNLPIGEFWSAGIENCKLMRLI